MPGVGIEPTRERVLSAPPLPVGLPGLAGTHYSRAREQLCGCYRFSASDGSFCSPAFRAPSRADRALSSPSPPERREADRPHQARAPRRLRSARSALSAAPARVLPPHARLHRGRRGRAAGGLRRLLQRHLRRRAADQRPPLALPDRAQPLPEPPPPPRSQPARTRWTSSSATAAPPPRTPCTSARSSARSSPTCRTCPRPSAPRCCCARSTRWPTTRSPRRWTPRCRA